jgi:hypothetical protein
VINRATNQQYWQTLGLLALAKTHTDSLNAIESALRSVLEVKESDEGKSGIGDPSHIGDALYSGYSTRELFEKLGITPPPDKLKEQKKQRKVRGK